MSGIPGLVAGLSPIAAQATQEVGDAVLSLAAGLLLDWLTPDARASTWSLEAIDDAIATGEYFLMGQGRPDSFRETAQNTVAVAGGFLTFDPTTLPTGGSPGSWEIEQTYAAPDTGVDLKGILVRLRNLRQRHPALRRPPKLRLSYGGVDETVWLESFEHAVPEGYWPGTDLPIKLQVRLRLVKARQHKLRAKPLVPRETTYRVLGDGETFESVAAEVYGDANLGDLVRRINPEVLEESPGVRLKLLDRDHPKMRASLAPRAPCFVERRAELAQAMAKERLEWSGAGWDVHGDLAEAEDGAAVLYES